MRSLATQVGAVLAVITTTLSLSGCPGGAPALQVTPAAIQIAPAQTEEDIAIRNSGSGTLSWQIEEVSRPNTDAAWVATDVPFLRLDRTSGSVTTNIDRVTLLVDRSGLAAGIVNNVGVRITSNGGERIVPIALQVAASLFVSPTTFALRDTATSASFTVSNKGALPAEFRVLFLPNGDDPDTTAPLPAGITATPATAQLNPGQSVSVTIGFPVGSQDFSLLVSSLAGSTPVRFRFGGQLTDLEVIPTTLRLYADQTGANAGGATARPSTLRIRNRGGATRSWSISARAIGGGNAPISIAPTSGSTPPGGETEVQVSISNVSTIETGAGNYELLVTSGDTFLPVPVIVDIVPLPIVTLSEAPDPAEDFAIDEINLLNFGTDEVIGEFWVVNTGSPASKLFFRVTNPDEFVEKPLIASVLPREGNTNSADQDFRRGAADDFIDGQKIEVIVNRDNLKQDVETRTITVTAYEEGFETPIAPVDVATITIRVERPPLKFEGAINRSRPPFVLRFVFMLRDSQGQVIPTRTPEDLSRLDFRIFEDGTLLDLSETNQFITGPDNLKVNLALLLDYTGSFYNAGTSNPEDPLAPGEAVALVKQAAKAFLDDLPPSYRVALLVYFDRQQTDRVISPFTSDREVLKAALDNFTLPPARFGVSEIRDALIDTIDFIAAEDADNVLPFDDADVRALVYITDGEDNASAATNQEVIDQALDKRVRLYPLVYSPNAETVAPGEPIVQAADTGGHFYNAGDVRNLQRLLATEASLVLEPVGPVAGDLVFFDLHNFGDTPLSWVVTEPIPWAVLTSASNGTLLPDATTRVSLRIVTNGLTPGAVLEGKVNVVSTGGNGTATLQLTVADDGLGGPAIGDVQVALSDTPGTLWREQRNQVVATYLTPKQADFSYIFEARYQDPLTARTISGTFEQPSIAITGDVRAGQLSLSSSGIFEDFNASLPSDEIRAEIYLRTDYVPRNVSSFRVRFFTTLPANAPAGAAAALAQAQFEYALAPGGALTPSGPYNANWRLVREADGSFILLTQEDTPLPYGAYGNLMKVTVRNLKPFVNAYTGTGIAPEFLVNLRADNTLYYAPATPGRPADVRYFSYPGGPSFPVEALSVTTSSDIASPAPDVLTLAAPPFDANALPLLDFDADGIPDYNDPAVADLAVPAAFIAPRTVSINTPNTQVSVTVRNNRLDTFTWAINPGTLPSWLSLDTASGTLAPGESQTIVFTADRTGLPPGFETATIEIANDFFESETLELTLII